MTDQKHTKELEKINDNRGLTPMQAYLLVYNLCSAVIKDLDDLRRQRDELRVALDNIIKASNGSGSFINAMVEGEKLLTKTKGDV